MSKEKDPKKNPRSEQNGSFDAEELLRSMKYDRWDHPIVIKAFNLMNQLNRWLRSCYAPEFCPHAHISVADFGVVIMVNDHLMWDSDTNEEMEMTLEFCKSRYKEYAAEMMVPFEDT